MLLSGAAVIALASAPAIAAIQAAAPAVAATAAVPNNVLLTDWTGPYEGVPPWDKVKPELFDEAFTFAIAELESANRSYGQR